MDPNEALRALLEMAEEAQSIVDNAAEDGTLTMEKKDRLADIAIESAQFLQGLDGWLSRGGFLPARWQKGRTN